MRDGLYQNQETKFPCFDVSGVRRHFKTRNKHPESCLKLFASHLTEFYPSLPEQNESKPKIYDQKYSCTGAGTRDRCPEDGKSHRKWDPDGDLGINMATKFQPGVSL